MVEVEILHRLILPLAALLHRADLYGRALHQLQDSLPRTRLEHTCDRLQKVARLLGIPLGRLVMDGFPMLRLDRLGVRQA